MKLKHSIIAAAFSIFAATSLASSGMEGQPAPDFALKSSTGQNLRLSEYRGDVVMINFWALAASQSSAPRSMSAVAPEAARRPALAVPPEAAVEAPEAGRRPALAMQAVDAAEQRQRGTPSPARRDFGPAG